MLISPKKSDRYIAALRNHLQKKIFRHGNIDEQLPALRKILLYTAVKADECAVPTDVNAFSDSLLGAAVLTLLGRGYQISTCLAGGGVFPLKRGTFTVLLLELIRCAARDGCAVIGVVCSGEEIRLTAFGTPPDATVRYLAKRLGGVCAYVARDNMTVIAIHIKTTAARPTESPDEWQYLLNPLSPVKAILSPLF